MAEETAKIKLYRKTYQLPQLNRPDLLVLQDQIQERQQLIKRICENIWSVDYFTKHN